MNFDVKATLIALTAVATLGLASPASAETLSFGAANLKVELPTDCVVTSTAYAKVKKTAKAKPGKAKPAHAKLRAKTKARVQMKCKSGMKLKVLGTSWADAPAQMAMLLKKAPKGRRVPKVRSSKTRSGHEALRARFSMKSPSGQVYVVSAVAVKGAAGRGIILLLGKQIDPKARGAVMRWIMSASKIMASIDDIKTPAKLMLMPSGDISKCPASTTIGTLKASVNIKGKKSPISVAPKRFKVAEAQYRGRRNELTIYVSTKDFGLDEYEIVPSPITTKNDGVLSIKVRTPGLKAGAYTTTGLSDRTLSASWVLKNLHASTMLGAGAKVEIIAITAKKVCGTFALQGMFKGDKTKVVGTFVAALPSK